MTDPSDHGLNPWDRLPGETSKQFAAFQVYLEQPPSKRSVANVRKNLGLKSDRHLYRWSVRHGWPARARSWDDEQARIRRMADNEALRDMARRHYNLADHMLALASMHLQQAVERARRTAATPGVNLNEIELRDVPKWAKAIVDIQRISLGNPLVLEANAADVGDAQVEREDRWRQLYCAPSDQVFRPHRIQAEYISDDHRFSMAVCGVQSGKTAGSAIKFWRKILDERPALRQRGDEGYYWLIAPNSIVGEVMCEAFENFAPPGEIVATKGSKSGKTWTLRDGARVQFRSGENADKLVARRLHGVWLDEFTLMKKDVWVTSVRQRLATTGGWGIFSGTPRGHNWAWDELWRRGLDDDDKHDPDYVGFTWPSSENPRITRAEVEAARRQLPAAYFAREWEASWESFHGQIFEQWSRARMFDEFRDVDEVGSNVFLGVDWGFANPGCVVAARRLPDGTWIVLEEIHVAKKLIGWWLERIAELWAKWKADRVYCDPSEPGHIAALVAEGIPARAANNDVHEGIRTMVKAMAQGRFFVDESCRTLAAQLGDYHWKEDRAGNRHEQPVKENDHAVDATRYAMHSPMEDEAFGRLFTYGGRKVPASG